MKTALQQALSYIDDNYLYELADDDFAYVAGLFKVSVDKLKSACK